MIAHPLYYLAAFAVALGVLIVAHELGHFLVARLCGVKVLRFSVGFGKPLLMRKFGADQTEWAVSLFPLGGYVKMLDEREGPVAVEELPRAFNRLPVSRRFLIVAAGPIANLLLAILLYWLLFMQGSEELRPRLAAPAQHSIAAAAGVEEGDLVRRVNGKAVLTWQEMRWELLQSVLEQMPLELETINFRQEIAVRRLDTHTLGSADLDADLSERIGLQMYRPRLKAIVGSVLSGSPSERAGIKTGDKVVAINGRPVAYWSDLVSTIRRSPGIPLEIMLQRGHDSLSVLVTPDDSVHAGQRLGRIGVGAQSEPAQHALLFVTVRYAPYEALQKAIKQTWDTSVISLKMIARMIAGELPWKNVSGPVTIADYAGQSAKMGWTYYLGFMAMISISLGVLNLLPIPVLDGGHLLYYVAEIIKGGPLPERVMEIGQQLGLTLLLALMALAFYNDINRLVSG